GFAPSNGICWEAYRAECLAVGKPDPGPSIRPETVVNPVLALDPAAAWAELGPYFLHDMNTYGGWLDGAGMVGPYQTTSLEELKEEGTYRILTPEECRADLEAMGGGATLMLHPMVGGIPPDLAW